MNTRTTNSEQSSSICIRSQNYVRNMAKRFEQIGIEPSGIHEANFKQCNWWNKAPESITCLDDLLSNDQQIYENEKSCDEFDRIDETAEVADENDVCIDEKSDTSSRPSSMSSTERFERNKFLHDKDQSYLPVWKKKSISVSVGDNKTSDQSGDGIQLLGNESSMITVSDSSNAEYIIGNDENQVNFTRFNTPNSNRPANRPVSTASNNSQLSSSSTASNSSTLSRTSLTSLNSMSSNQATNILEELLINEETYIRSLNHGIDCYMKTFDRKGMPAELRGKKYHVFGNIHRIKYFHENFFYPALKNCNMDIVKICNVFCDFIEKDFFYVYILYAINRQKSEKICDVHRDYFKEIQNEATDKLGVNSFLVQPIQRLPKYKLLLGQLFSQLGKRISVHDDSTKNEIAACCLADKRLQRLLDTVNGSMNINDIVGCNELHTLCQGKFILVDRFDVIERNDLRRRYKGKVFLFERCVIYTQIEGKNKLLYRGHFRYSTLGFTFEDQRNYFKLYNERRGNQEIEFHSDPQTLHSWIQTLNRVMEKVVLREKKKIDDHRNLSPRSDSSPLNVLVRINSPSPSYMSSADVTSANSLPFVAFRNSASSGCETPKASFLDDSNSDSISLKSSQTTDSQLSNRTTWYTELEDERRLIERFQNSERFYIQLLEKAIKTYLTDLPNDLHTQLDPFLLAIKKILRFHTNTFYPNLLQCEMRTTAICDLIKNHIYAKDFQPYIKYSALVQEALHLVRDYNKSKEQCDDGCINEIEELLFIPIKHMDNYAIFLDKLLNEYKSRDFLAEDFKTIAAVEIEMKKLHKLIMENLSLNSMKGTMCLARKFGLIVYSDEITIDSLFKSRLMVLDKGLVCVRTRISTKSKKEKYIDLVFSIPMKSVELHENDLYPRKLKVSAEKAAHINYTISFSTTGKKKRFMDAIRTHRNKLDP